MEKRLTQIFLLVFLVSIGIFAWSLWRRPIHIDDVWLAEYSFWLEKLGFVKSEAMRGFFNAENKLYVYHKLLAIEGALAIRWFGFSPYVLKSISLVFLVGSLWALQKMFRKQSLLKSGIFLLFALTFSFFHTVNLSFTFRPEIHLMFWGLVSFICLERYLDKPDEKVSLIAGGILSGFGTATHLNGVVFTGATVAFLWIYRRWWAGFIFGTVASWGLFFYFLFDARTVEEIKLSFHQLTHWRDVATGKYGAWDALLRVFTEQGRFLHSPPEIIYTFLILFLLIPTRKVLWKEHKRLLLYSGVLLFFVAEVTHGTNTNYLMYTFPFFILLATYGFETLVRQGRIKYACIIVAIFLAGSWGYNVDKFSHREENDLEYKKVAKFLPNDAKVLSPAYLMFPGLGKVRIQSFVVYRDKVEAKELSATPEDLTTAAEKFDIEYIVFDESNLNFFNIKAEVYGRYRLMAEQPSALFKIYQAYEK